MCKLIEWKCLVPAQPFSNAAVAAIGACGKYVMRSRVSKRQSEVEADRADKIEKSVQLHQVVLYGGAADDDAVLGGDAGQLLRGQGLAVLDGVPLHHQLPAVSSVVVWDAGSMHWTLMDGLLRRLMHILCAQVCLKVPACVLGSAILHKLTVAWGSSLGWYLVQKDPVPDGIGA